MKQRKWLSIFGLMLAVIMAVTVVAPMTILLAEESGTTTTTPGITGEITDPGTDDDANTGNKDHNNDANNVGDNKDNWAMNGTGTRYTIVFPDGTSLSTDLDAGEALFEDVKGYQSSGYANIDVYGSEFDLPAGQLELSREEWAAVARKEGRDDIAEAILNGERFQGTTEQYIYGGHLNSPWGSEYGYRHHTVTELRKMFNDPNTPGNTKTLKQALEAGLAAFTEEDVDLYTLLGYIDAMGWGGYQYVDETTPPPVEEEPSEEPPSEEPPSEEPPSEEPPSEEPPSEDPTPTPEPTPEPDPYWYISNGVAGEASHTANGTIDDDNTNPKFDVLGGGPIPVTENLDVRVYSDLGGYVSQLGMDTAVFPANDYSVSKSWKVTYEFWDQRNDYDRPIYDTNESGEEYFTGRYEQEDFINTTSTSGTETYVGVKSGSVGGIIDITGSTKWYTTTQIVVDNVTLEGNPVTFPVAGYTFTPVIDLDDSERVTGGPSYSMPGTNSYYVDINGDASDVIAAAEATAYAQAMACHGSRHVSAWWSITPDILQRSDGANVGASVSSGAQLLPMNYEKLGLQIPSSIKNKSVGGAQYPTNAYHVMTPGGAPCDLSISINGVSIHTPIYNELTFSTSSKNQLKNNSLAAGDPIVKLGDSFSLGINTTGYTYYYGTMDTSKYIGSYEIFCGVCEAETGNGWLSTSHHTHVVDEDVPDNVHYHLASRVVAINGPGNEDYSTWNQPDDIYELEQSDSVYIVGKIYDMQVRTTNDTGWKLNEAQKLDKMPIGEVYSSSSVVENANKLYKYAIKLGYRAYFDFKTLGIASVAVDLDPKLYYLDENGNIDTNVDFYFKTSPTQYSKLVPDDVLVKMTFNSTKGEVNNAEFIKEKVATVNSSRGAMDFSKVIQIGKLTKLSLNTDSWLQSTRKNSEKRWYAEIYMPASTVVATAGTSTTDVANGKNIKKTGYVVVTFEDVTSKLGDGTDYLQYSMVKDHNGSILPFSQSIMAAEKAGKNSVSLPKGKTFTAYAETEIPVIVYDLSLKANNDFETDGTH